MSTSLTAAVAIKGARYTDKGGHLVTFLGPSAKHANMYAMLVVETKRQIDSVPADYPLWLADEAALKIAESIAAIKGQPRDALEPKLRELDDDQLDALMTADTRMWVTHAIGAELERRRVGLQAAIVKLPEVQRALDTAPIGRIGSAIVPPIAIVGQGEIDVEEIPLVAEADEAPPWLATDPTTIEEVAAEEDHIAAAAPTAYTVENSEATANTAVEYSDPHSEVTPAPAPAPVVAKIRRPRNYEEKLGALGYPVEVYEAMSAEEMRAILEAKEPPLYVAPVVHRPGPARDARCPCCERVIVDILGEAPTAVEVEGVWGCADCYDDHRWPPPIEQLPRVSLAAALRLVAAAPLGDLVRWTAAEASGPAREEVLDAISARIAGASDAEHEAADRASDPADDGGNLRCPKCSAEVHWGCSADTGARGSAWCSESGRATRMVSTPPTCDWSGSVVRLADGGVALVVPEAERILGPVAPDPVAMPLPGPNPIADEQAHALRFLAERDVVLEGDDYARFGNLTGSVRDCTIGLRGTDARLLPLVEAALVWATDHDAGATVVSMLEKRVRQLRGAPTTEARPARPGPTYRRTTEASAAPAVVLSPAGEEQAAAIQAALARLSAAVPGYVAAMEALVVLRDLGVTLDLGSVASDD